MQNCVVAGRNRNNGGVLLLIKLNTWINGIMESKTIIQHNPINSKEKYWFLTYPGSSNKTCQSKDVYNIWGLNSYKLGVYIWNKPTMSIFFDWMYV